MQLSFHALYHAIKSYASVLKRLRPAASHRTQVTGTAKQHVADDYNMRIAAGREEADAVTRRGLEALLLRRRELLGARTDRNSAAELAH